MSTYSTYAASGGGGLTGGSYCCICAANYQITADNWDDKVTLVCFCGNPSSASLCMPNATTLDPGANLYTIKNGGSATTIVARDAASNILGIIKPCNTSTFSLVTNGDCTGQWSLQNYTDSLGAVQTSSASSTFKPKDFCCSYSNECGDKLYVITACKEQCYYEAHTFCTTETGVSLINTLEVVTCAGCNDNSCAYPLKDGWLIVDGFYCNCQGTSGTNVGAFDCGTKFRFVTINCEGTCATCCIVCSFTGTGPTTGCNIHYCNTGVKFMSPGGMNYFGFLGTFGVPTANSLPFDLIAEVWCSNTCTTGAPNLCRKYQAYCCIPINYPGTEIPCFIHPNGFIIKPGSNKTSGHNHVFFANGSSVSSPGFWAVKVCNDVVTAGFSKCGDATNSVLNCYKALGLNATGLSAMGGCVDSQLIDGKNSISGSSTGYYVCDHPVFGATGYSSSQTRYYGLQSMCWSGSTPCHYFAYHCNGTRTFLPPSGASENRFAFFKFVTPRIGLISPNWCYCQSLAGVYGQCMTGPMLCLCCIEEYFDLCCVCRNIFDTCCSDFTPVFGVQNRYHTPLEKYYDYHDPHNAYSQFSGNSFWSKKCGRTGIYYTEGKGYLQFPRLEWSGNNPIQCIGESCFIFWKPQNCNIQCAELAQVIVSPTSITYGCRFCFSTSCSLPNSTGCCACWGITYCSHGQSPMYSKVDTSYICIFWPNGQSYRICRNCSSGTFIAMDSCEQPTGFTSSAYPFDQAKIYSTCHGRFVSSLCLSCCNHDTLHKPIYWNFTSYPGSICRDTTAETPGGSCRQSHASYDPDSCRYISIHNPCSCFGSLNGSVVVGILDPATQTSQITTSQFAEARGIGSCYLLDSARLQSFTEYPPNIEAKAFTTTKRL